MVEDSLQRKSFVPPRAVVRLSDVLFARDRLGFASFVPLPSNASAFEAATLFANGLAPFVAIAGPSGWGKTHLLRAMTDTLRADWGTPAVVRSAAEWVAAAGRHDAGTPLVLDDVQDVLARPRLRQHFRRLLERRVQAGRPVALALTHERPERTWRSLLPMPHEWAQGWVRTPEATERILVLRGMAANEKVGLADALVRLLAQKAPGNGLTFAGALSRLRLIQDRWQDAPAILRACGILVPFLSDSRGWDLRDHVYDSVTAFWTRSRRPLPVGPHEFAVYAMLELVGLPERDVAAYLQLDPGDAYAIASIIAERRRRGTLDGVVEPWSDDFVATLERL